MTPLKTRRALYAATASAAIIAVAFSAGSFVLHERHLAAEQLAASRVESANIDLQDEMARLRDQVAASSRDLAAAQGRVGALTEEMRAHAQAPDRQAAAPTVDTTAPVKGDKVSQLSQQLHVAEAQRATLAARLSKAETDLADQQAKQNDLLGQIDQWQKKLEQLSSDRDRLKVRVGELEKQSALRHAQQQVAEARPVSPVPAPAANAVPVPTTAAAAARPQAAPAEAPQRVAGILNAPATVAAPAPVAVPVAAAPAPAVASKAALAVGHSAVDHFARVLASAGVDVRHLFAEFGVNRGEGGPFIPVSRGQVPDTTLSPEKLAALRAMVKALPVTAPLQNYEVSSPFGVRGDPENGHAGFHTGIDLTAPYDTPVYATAPGIVTFAGFRDDYGKIVEIDHGNGIATRYAHLHAFTVSVGQRIAAHTQVGYLGSTGRATGPHVHYEIVVNGEPQDPEKFFGLARYVPSIAVPVAARN
ncbi:MAG TPA: peptidoglycan DD-metalloendopeptidase family protein [Stellaceae bacterium]|nr:peptidoglycan DD-metalloendopeptidase family protein [Stellaceae bacterium]